MSVLHHHLRDSGFHEGCVRQEKLVLLLTELDTRLAQRWETLQKRVTGPEDLLAAPVSQQTSDRASAPTALPPECMGTGALLPSLQGAHKTFPVWRPNWAPCGEGSQGRVRPTWLP